MLKLTIDLYHFMPLSDVANMAEGHDVRGLPTLLALFFSHSSQLIGIEFGVAWTLIKLNILVLLLRDNVLTPKK